MEIKMLLMSQKKNSFTLQFNLVKQNYPKTVEKREKVSDFPWTKNANHLFTVYDVLSV